MYSNKMRGGIVTAEELNKYYPKHMEVTNLEFNDNFYTAKIKTVVQHQYCPECKKKAIKGKPKTIKCIDKYIDGYPLKLEIETHAYQCKNESCNVNFFSSQNEKFIKRFARKTNRFTDVHLKYIPFYTVNQLKLKLKAIGVLVTTEALEQMYCDNQDYIDVRRESLKRIPKVKIEHFNLKKSDVFKMPEQVVSFKKDDAIEKLFLAKYYPKELTINRIELRDDIYYVSLQTYFDKLYCPACGVKAAKAGYANTKAIDKLIDGKKTILKLKVSLGLCNEEDCDMKYFKYKIDNFVDKGQYETKRYKDTLYQLVKKYSPHIVSEKLRDTVITASSNGLYELKAEYEGRSRKKQNEIKDNFSDFDIDLKMFNLNYRKDTMR